MARKTRYQELQNEARERGFLVRRNAPGDGITRYRFFELPADPHQTYFGPENPTCTALGIKAAYGFVYTGRCARGRWRGPLRGSLGARRVITVPRVQRLQMDCDRLRREFDMHTDRHTTVKKRLKAKELPRVEGVRKANGIRRLMKAIRVSARRNGCSWPRRTKLPSKLVLPKPKKTPQMRLF
jgi:hypothetical protein